MNQYLDNPVARAHHRDRSRTDGVGDSLAGRALLWTVVVPGVLLLVSNPVGWVLLVLGALAVFTLAPALGS